MCDLNADAALRALQQVSAGLRSLDGDPDTLKAWVAHQESVATPLLGTIERMSCEFAVRIESRKPPPHPDVIDRMKQRFVERNRMVRRVRA